MDLDHLSSALRSKTFSLGKRLDRRGGWTSIASRTSLGAVRSLRDSVQHHELRTITWSPRRGMWILRWPEGKVASPRRWREWRDWATSGGYDMDDLLFRYYRPRESDVVVDVGAGHGGETFALANMVGPRGLVVAIEAAPSTYRQLIDLCQLNGWTHVDPVQIALSSGPGIATLSDAESWVTANIYEAGDVEVATIALDDLCRVRGISNIDWLKMNIEGAEKDAILGMEEMAPKIRNMTISCHDFLGTEWGKSKEHVVAWLVGHGFTVRERSDGEPWARDYIYASRPSASST